MERFKNILVGVDLSEADRFISDKPAAPSEAAIDRALWLAKANSARVLFMFSRAWDRAAQTLVEGALQEACRFRRRQFPCQTATGGRH